MWNFHIIIFQFLFSTCCIMLNSLKVVYIPQWMEIMQLWNRDNLTTKSLVIKYSRFYKEFLPLNILIELIDSINASSLVASKTGLLFDSEFLFYGYGRSFLRSIFQYNEFIGFVCSMYNVEELGGFLIWKMQTSMKCLNWLEIRQVLHSTLNEMYKNSL